MTDEAIAWTSNVRAADRDKPWFVYFSTSGVHAPHQRPKEWREQYRGRFDHGWDRQRELTHAKQLAMGVIPGNTKLTPRPPEIPAWDSVPAEARTVYTRLMENYAAYMAYTDFETGRLIDSLAASGELDNTLVMYVVGDNGASAEGGLEGTFSELASLLGIQLGLESTIKRLDEIGGPTSEPHVPVGWAWAMDAPFQWTKQVASHFGGTRNPMVVHWPRGIKSKGETAHPVPPCHRRRADDPGSLQDPGAEDRQRHPAEADRGRVDALLVRRPPVPEAGGPRSISNWPRTGRSITTAGWRAAGLAYPGKPLVVETVFSMAPWELYQHRGRLQPGRRPRRQRTGKAQGVAGAVPRRGEEVRRVPARSAVFRADGPRNSARPASRGRAGPTTGTVSGCRNRSGRSCFPRGHTITAELTIPKEGAEGVVTCCGAFSAGWSLYIQEGKPTFRYTFFDLADVTIPGTEAIPEGKATLRSEFAPDGSPTGGGTLKTVRQRQARGRRPVEALGVPTRPGTVRGRTRLDHASCPGLQEQRDIPVHGDDRKGHVRAHACASMTPPGQFGEIRDRRSPYETARAMVARSWARRQVRPVYLEDRRP